jgi:glyoxylase-like metal-dependent hydrolase (beta-lactamase superfamily II)
MNYVVVSTGSKGNAVIIEDFILIDCGVSFKALSEKCSKLKIVLLTHIHS